MKRWAFITVGLYLLALVALTGPLFLAAFGWGDQNTMTWEDIRGVFQEGSYWLWIGGSVIAQVLLLVVPVAKAKGRPVKRRGLLTAIITSAFLLAFLGVACVATVAVVIWRDDGLRLFEVFGDDNYRPLWVIIAYISLVWVAWAGAFWWLYRRAEPGAAADRVSRWLLAGSILELLVAVPSHVFVRHRHDCCAPFATFWGIAAGVSVMLLAFGPGVFFLFVKRAQRLRPRSLADG